MAMDRAAETFFGNGEAYLYRVFCIGRRIENAVDYAYGKNRKRFPGEEKRVNMLLSLEPLIYFESITNGE